MLDRKDCNVLFFLHNIFLLKNKCKPFSSKKEYFVRRRHFSCARGHVFFEVKPPENAFFFVFRLVFPEKGNILTDALPP